MKQPTHTPHQPHLPFLIFIAVASALGGFLWGFDAIVISGTISSVKEQFGLSSGMEGLFVSSGLIGAVMGSALAGWLSDRFGRSRNLALAALLMLISALASAWAPSIELLVLARWIGGLGVGISAMVCPLYISEVSPAHLRGRMVTIFQFAITFGILVALFNNVALHRLAQSLAENVENSAFLNWFVVDETWRVMFASEILPGVLFLAMATRLPESPRWLMKSGNKEAAGKILHRIFKQGAEQELQQIEATIAEEDASKKRFIDVFSHRYRKPLVIAMLLAAFAQFSGINVVFYYGPSMLESAGLKSDGALSGMAVIGFFNMIFTVIAMAFVDKAGRRLLLQIGTMGAIACLVGVGASFHSGANTILIVLMCAFVAFFAFSLGPIKFIFASEIFPTNIRSHAMSIVILTMWAADTLVGQFTPMMRDGIGARDQIGWLPEAIVSALPQVVFEGIGPHGLFFLFAAILVPQIFLVWKFMPETAGRSLEEIENSYS